jgi:26S proteasome regulatory subunit N11
MDRIQRMFAGGGAGAQAQGPATDTPQVDTAEQIYISSLALIKMLKHGQALTQGLGWHEVMALPWRASL